MAYELKSKQGPGLQDFLLFLREFSPAPHISRTAVMVSGGQWGLCGGCVDFIALTIFLTFVPPHDSVSLCLQQEWRQALGPRCVPRDR
jgi:hypothetical protein